jgi:galactofuranosylgalactofuranosylrhamnosyl-N-acetylglucosaminyl-diphospho-decaprenol beta-1,5/1,6-galactofuranosyltransferase
MDYYTVKLRQLAYESVLAGPDKLHDELTTRLPQIRALSKNYRESTLVGDLNQFDNFPSTSYVGNDESPIHGRKVYRFLLTNFIRHGLTKPHDGSAVRPDVHLSRSAPWWIVPNFDSVAITNAEGSGVAWHVRDRAQFRSLLWSSLTKNLRYRNQWAKLSSTYRNRLSTITSEESWRRTLNVPRPVATATTPSPTPDSTGVPATTPAA